MDSASSSTSKFASTLKSVAANVAVMIVINLAIKGAIALWDKYNITVAETQEKIDDINSSLSTLNSEYDELKSRDIDTLSDSEKTRLDYLKRRIEAEERLLQLEKQKQAQESVGTKFTDAFDKDNLNNQYAQIVDDYAIYGANISRNLKDYQENLAKFEETGESKYKEKADKYESKINRDLITLQENLENLYTMQETVQSYIDEGLLSGEDLTNAQALLENIGTTIGYYEGKINSVDNSVSKTVEKVDALAERLKNISSEDLQENFSAEEINLLSNIEFDENATIEDLEDILEEAQKKADENPIEGTISFEDSSTQLKSLSEQITKISDMLADKNNGTVASIFDLAGFDAEVRGLDSWKEFERVMGSSKSSMEECQSAANALATEWFNNGTYLASLNEENKQFYITQMQNMGVKNAETIVTERLTASKEVAANTEKALSLATSDLNDKQKSYTQKSADVVNATYEQSAAFVEHANMSATAKVELANLVAEQTIFNNQGLNVSDKIASLGELAGAYLGAAAQASFLAKTQGGLNSQYRISAEEAWAQVLDEFKVVNSTIPTIDIDKGGSSNYTQKKTGSGSSKDSKSSIDWIERRLTVLQNAIDKTKAKFENLFTFKAKNNNLEKQITQTETLLKATQTAADKYKEKANNVNLSASLKKKVREGSYNINDYDSDTAEKIQKYQNYWDQYKSKLVEVEKLNKQIRDTEIEQQQLISDNAQSKIDQSNAEIAIESNYKKQNDYLEQQKKYVKDKYDAEIKIAEINKDIVKQKTLEAQKQKEINDLTKEQFDKIAEGYANRMKINSDKVSLIQADLSIAEAKGDIIGSRYYTKQMSLNKTQIQNYKDEINEEIAALNTLKLRSPEWYDAKDKILQDQLEVKRLEEENVNLQNSINNLKFDRFDDLLDKLSDITDETDFLISLLDSDNFFDDNGNITDDGLTAMGLSAMNYDTYMAQADKYKGMIADLEEMYNNGNGTIGYEEYTSKMREYQQGQRDSILAANDAKKAVIDYAEQGLKAQNDALAESIDKRKELLNSEQDLYEFQKKINDQNKNIADLKKQIAALEGDDSLENRKKLQQLKSDLAEAEQEQKDTLYDRSVSDIEDALDEMLENSMNAAEEYLSDSERVFMDSLNYVNAHTSQVANNLEAISKEVGYDISEYIGNAWESAGDAVDTYQNILQGNVPNIVFQIDQITEAWGRASKAAEDAAESIVADTQTNYGVQDTANQKVADYLNSHLNKGQWERNKLGVLDQYLYDQTGGYVLSEKEQIELADLLGVTVDKNKFSKEDRQNILEELKKLKLTWDKNSHTATYTPQGFATGGIIDTKDILKRSGEQGFIIANNGEAVLTKPQWKLIREFADGLNNFKIQTPKLPDIQPRNIQSPVYHIDNSVTVEGIATDQIVKDMEKVAQKQAENTIAKINSLTYSKGVRYK